jgi:hypothetical protein
LAGLQLSEVTVAGAAFREGVPPGNFELRASHGSRVPGPGVGDFQLPAAIGGLPGERRKGLIGTEAPEERGNVRRQE